MSFSTWANADLFSVLRDKINAVITWATIAENAMPAIGTVLPYFGSTAPNAYWKIPNGDPISRTDYAEFFALVGTTYGVGDGSTTFNMPDMRGRAVIGFDATVTEFNTIGKTGGVKEVTLTANQSGLRDHSHNMSTYDDTGGTLAVVLAGSDGIFVTDIETSGSINADGNASRDGAQPALDAHTNLPPYIAPNYIIRVK